MINALSSSSSCLGASSCCSQARLQWHCSGLPPSISRNTALLLLLLMLLLLLLLLDEETEMRCGRGSSSALRLLWLRSEDRS